MLLRWPSLKRHLPPKRNGLKTSKVKLSSNMQKGLISPVKFLYSDLDVSSCGYFKEVKDGQLVNKPPPSSNLAEPEAADQMGPLGTLQ